MNLGVTPRHYHQIILAPASAPLNQQWRDGSCGLLGSGIIARLSQNRTEQIHWRNYP